MLLHGFYHARKKIEIIQEKFNCGQVVGKTLPPSPNVTPPCNN